MDPIEYCRLKAAPDGSALYYAMLFAPAAARDALLALLALERELADVVEKCSDVAIARRKLAYWQQELLASEPAGGAAHPVRAALRASGAEQALDDDLRARLLRGTARRIDSEQVRDADELAQTCADTAGSVARGCALMLEPGRSQLAAQMEQLAVGLELMRLLRVPRRAGRPPHGSVPLDELSRFGVSARELDSATSSAGVRALREHRLQAARETIEAAARALGAGAPGFARARARLALVELDAFVRHGYLATGNPRGVTPLRRLWTAWRHGRG